MNIPLLKRLADKELLVLLCLPLLLLWLFQLPPSLKEQLVLNYDNPQFLSLFTTHFIHEDSAHLLGNVVMYMLLIPPIYLLNTLADQRKGFYLMFVLIFIPLPFLLSAANLMLRQFQFLLASRGMGFSGIVSAFAGFLPCSILVFLKKSYKWKTNIVDLLFAIYLVSVGIIPLVYFEFDFYNLLLLMIIWGLFLRLLYKILKKDILRHCLSSLKRARGRNKRILQLAAVSVLIYLLAILYLFPEKVVYGRMIIDIISHYIGLVLAFSPPMCSSEPA
jgi:hypothetical protein